MKKAIVLVLCGILVTLFLASCNDPGNRTEGTVTQEWYSTEEQQEMSTSKFSQVPYSNAKEGTKLSDDEIKAVILNVPSDKYETYPDIKMNLLAATLYHDGKAISIDLKDPRLIKLVNLFLNTVYYRQISYTQGLLTGNYIEDLENENFKLVLICEYGGDGIHDGSYDTITITNKWFGMYDHTASNYNDENLPYVMGYSPLHSDYHWLNLFGF